MPTTTEINLNRDELQLLAAALDSHGENDGADPNRVSALSQKLQGALTSLPATDLSAESGQWIERLREEIMGWGMNIGNRASNGFALNDPVAAADAALSLLRHPETLQFCPEDQQPEFRRLFTLGWEIGVRQGLAPAP